MAFEVRAHYWSLEFVRKLSGPMRSVSKISWLGFVCKISGPVGFSVQNVMALEFVQNLVALEVRVQRF